MSPLPVCTRLTSDLTVVSSHQNIDSPDASLPAQLAYSYSLQDSS